MPITTTSTIPCVEFDDSLALNLGTGETIREQLDWAFSLDPGFKEMFDDARLHVNGGAEAAEVALLIARSPTDWAAGYVAGLYVNN